MEKFKPTLKSEIVKVLDDSRLFEYICPTTYHFDKPNYVQIPLHVGVKRHSLTVTQ